MLPCFPYQSEMFGNASAMTFPERLVQCTHFVLAPFIFYNQANVSMPGRMALTRLFAIRFVLLRRPVCSCRHHLLSSSWHRHRMGILSSKIRFFQFRAGVKPVLLALKAVVLDVLSVVRMPARHVLIARAAVCSTEQRFADPRSDSPC